MPRHTPLTTQCVHAISDLGRTLNVMFMQDGRIDDAEREALQLTQHAADRAAWADYARRRAQHTENYGLLSPRMVHEARELESDFGPEAA